jgi:hypothetical protein
MVPSAALYRLAQRPWWRFACDLEYCPGKTGGQAVAFLSLY